MTLRQHTQDVCWMDSTINAGTHRKKSDSSCWHLSRNVSASCLRGRMRLIAFCKIKSMRTLNGSQETLSSNLTLLPPSRVHLYDDEIPCRNRSVAHLPKRFWSDLNARPSAGIDWNSVWVWTEARFLVCLKMSLLIVVSFLYMVDRKRRTWPQLLSHFKVSGAVLAYLKSCHCSDANGAITSSDEVKWIWSF